MLAHEAVKTANMFSSLTKTNSMGGSSTASASSGTPTSSTASSKKKSKSKKKKTKTKTDDASTADNKSPAEQEENPSQLPLARRLEVAAAIPDTHAALVGLLGWSRLYVHTDTILTFFQSDALCLLLGNLLCSRPAATVLDNLEALLANCLSVESSSEPTDAAPHRQMAGEVVAAVRAIADQSQGDVEDADDVNAEAERAAKSLSRLVRAHALSLHGVDLDSPLTKDVQDLEAKIAQVTNADEAVRGQTIRESFQRRDLRSDALSLHERRLQQLTKLVEERVRSSEQQHQAEEEAEEDDDSPEDNTHTAEDETLMQEVTKSLQDMQDRKDAELAPLRTKKTAASAEVQTLRQKQEELETQLRAVKSELQRAVGEQHQADEDMRAVEERFIADTARFRAEHQHVTRRFSRAQRRRVISTEVSRVESEVRQARLAHSQVHTLRAKQTACISQQLEASLNYFESELPCVKFMMSRVEENEAKLAPMRGEIASYRALGVSAVAEELEEKAVEIEAHVEEDRNCLTALHKRDEELLDSMRRILTDSSLRDALAGVEERIKHESQRMIDYVSKLYEDSSSHLAKELKSNGTIGSKKQ
ncbi:uncharacterized protein PITG_11114 [Phytophthora infestans T30-4]|uniref:Uncharacterized protein n=2 Tax=Phytophthora infestans TaxID=4787 RepID=D0NG76_PHYIT|nr:uncharacterized protein PITG_11114 [Phytophthora infestans T30-4]EEY57277.1 conserved hypothetical protein [Phytophthora infestans T30-4]KAF4046609.1 hypothetical protein GN244_ATG00999 [Phytophthora infestans]KAF4130149.1 hypothetical protein GN958_ATG20564 [Phytophthora infestans]KAI9996775.1 hypothetical protein PInf_000037 [Phytophthora infestans]|eukprot:XP_002901887.1 conserved hypothetical protein [Phytophthora infestans T30-4]